MVGGQCAAKRLNIVGVPFLLVRAGGAAILWLGERADLARLAVASEQLGGGAPKLHDGLAVLPKVAPTPPGFPRRVGVAKKRPLA